MIKNIIANWAEIVFTTLSVFILYPFLVGEMGESQYGVWLLIASLTGYFSLLQLGIPISIVRHISKYYATKDYNKVNAVVNSSLGLFLSLSFIVIITGLIIMLLADKIFKIPSEYVFFARVSIIIVTVNIGMNFIFEVLEGMMHAFQNFVILNSIKIGLLFLRVALTFLVVTYSNGLLVLAFILMIISLLQGLSLFFYIRKKYTFLRFNLKLFEKPILKEIFNYSVYALLLQMASRIAFQTDPMVIGAVISTSAIVYFTLGNNFMIYLTEFIRGIARALMPKTSDLDSKNEQNQLKNVFINYSKLTYFIVLLACTLFIMIGKDFIAIWMGESFREPSGNVLIILSISYLFFLVQRGVGHPILMGTSNIKFPTYTMIITALVNLFISIYLGEHYGIEGVAWGTTIPNLIYTVILIIYTTRFLEISVFKYFVQTIFVPSFSAFFIIAPIILIKQFLFIDSYVKFFIVAIIVSIIYSLSVFFIFIGRENKKVIMRLVRR